MKGQSAVIRISTVEWPANAELIAMSIESNWRPLSTRLTNIQEALGSDLYQGSHIPNTFPHLLKENE
jgi:hypothetical protein